MNSRLPLLATLVAILLMLAGCDLEAMLADPKVAQRAADAKAIGSACRHGLRSIEDCYALNEKVSKAGIFDGWKEMDQYMRENKIDGIPAKVLKDAGPAEEIITEPKAADPKAAKPTGEAPADKAASEEKSKAKAKAAVKPDA